MLETDPAPFASSRDRVGSREYVRGPRVDDVCDAARTRGRGAFRLAGVVTGRTLARAALALAVSVSACRVVYVRPNPHGPLFDIRGDGSPHTVLVRSASVDDHDRFVVQREPSGTESALRAVIVDTARLARSGRAYAYAAGDDGTVLRR